MSNIIWVNTEYLIRKYGVTKQAIQKWRDKGLPYEKLGHRTIRYNKAEVDKYFKYNPRKDIRRQEET